MDLIFKKMFLFFFTFLAIQVFPYQSYGEETVPTSLSTEASQVKFPFVGKSKGAHINVRSGGNLNYEVLTRLEDGQEVIVLREVLGWFEILPPEGVCLWIHQSFVKDNQIMTDSVNIRSRPSLESSVNAQMSRGETIEPILQEGEWLKIKPPAGARSWVNKDYVIYDRPYEMVPENPASHEKNTPPVMTSAQALKLIEDFERGEFYKPVDQIQFDELTARYEKLIQDFPRDQQLKIFAQKKIADIHHQKETLLSKKSEEGNRKETPSEASLSEPSEPKETSVKAQQNVSEDKTSHEMREEKNSTEQIFEGRLEPEGIFSNKKRFKLIHDKRRVCFLIEGEIVLKDYVHQEVKISGSVISWEHPRIPVIRVEKIEKVNS